MDSPPNQAPSRARQRNQPRHHPQKTRGWPRQPVDTLRYINSNLWMAVCLRAAPFSSLSLLKKEEEEKKKGQNSKTANMGKMPRLVEKIG
ncbi:MAG: hypothetical protein KKG67_20565 [Gammaproteobacteria bacterium]|nr:hypothetical protein [Gammaproteobacteria bacterium]